MDARTRERLGIVGTEAACDWTVRYADISSPLRPSRDLHGFLNGGVPQLGLQELEQNLDKTRRMSALLEMTNHEFLDGSYRKERTTFADGTTVTVDWDAGTVVVKP